MSKRRHELYVEPRIKFEDEPEELIPWVTVVQESKIYTGNKKWAEIGRRYNRTATEKISNEIREEVESRASGAKKK